MGSCEVSTFEDTFYHIYLFTSPMGCWEVSTFEDTFYHIYIYIFTSPMGSCEVSTFEDTFYHIYIYMCIYICIYIFTSPMGSCEVSTFEDTFYHIYIYFTYGKLWGVDFWRYLLPYIYLLHLWEAVRCRLLKIHFTSLSHLTKSHATASWPVKAACCHTYFCFQPHWLIQTV